LRNKYYDLFIHIIKDLYLNKKDKIIEEIKKLNTEENNNMEYMRFYRIKENIDYKKLLEDFIEYNSSL
jgi:hypothetical protein